MLILLQMALYCLLFILPVKWAVKFIVPILIIAFWNHVTDFKTAYIQAYLLLIVMIRHLGCILRCLFLFIGIIKYETFINNCFYSTNLRRRKFTKFVRKNQQIFINNIPGKKIIRTNIECRGDF